MFRKNNKYTLTEKAKSLLNGTFDADALLDLIHQGADSNVKDSSGNSVLHCFILHKVDRELIRKLVIQYKANVEIKNKKGHTSLQVLMDNPCNIGEAMTLVRLKANPDTKDSKGCPLLHRLIISHASHQIIREMVETFKADIEIKDQQGQTALQCLMNEPSCTVMDAVNLVRLGANPTTKDKNGNSLLDRAISSQTSPEIIQELNYQIQKSANSSSQNNTKDGLDIIDTGEYKYSSVSRWFEPKSGKEKKQQEKLDAMKEKIQKKMEADYDHIFRL